MFQEHGIKHIDVDITDACNLACKYCYHGSNKNINTKVDKSVKEKLKRVLASEDPTIHFFGGEPLVNFEDIKDIVEEAKITNWGITSNIILLDNKKKEFFLNNNGKVHVSIDGNRDAHNMQRITKGGKGSYDYVLSKIPNALEINPQDTARMTVQPEIAHMVYDSIVSLARLGFNSIAPMPVLEAEWSDKQWKMYDKSLERAAKWNLTRPFISIKNFADSMRGMFNPRVRTRNCGAGFGLVAVSTDGEITPCHRFSDRKDFSYTGEDVTEYSFGNINTGGIDEKKLQKWRNSFGTIPDQCQSCEVVFSCSGACPNVATRMNGHPNTIVPNHCNYMKVSMPHARWLLVQFQMKKIDNIYERRMNPNFRVNKEKKCQSNTQPKLLVATQPSTSEEKVSSQ